MADNDFDKIMTELNVQLKVSGVPDAQASFNEILASEQDVLNNAGALIASYGGVSGAVKQLVKSHKSRAKAADQATKKGLAGAKKLRTSYGALGGAIGEATGALKKMIMPTSFGATIGLTMDYSKSLLTASASVNRLGIGLASLETSLQRTASSVNLTRMETIGLFEQFQTGMRFISLQQFEDILKRSRNLVGANAEAIGKLQDAIAGVSQEYPGLAMGLANLAKEGSRLDKAEKNQLQNRIRNLFFIGKITDAQYKQLSAYVSGNQQAIGADRERQAEMQRNIKLQQDFRRQIERIGLIVGQTLLPPLVEVAEIMQKLIGGAESWLGTATKIGIAYAGIKLGGGMLGAGLRGAGGIAKKGMGAMFSPMKMKGGIAGTVGKAAGVIGGSGTPVYVTNLNEMSGFLGKDIGQIMKDTPGTPGTPGAPSRMGKFGNFMMGGAKDPGLGKLAKLGKFAKSPTAIITSVVGSMGLGKLEGFLSKQGMGKSAAAAGVGSDVLAVGGAAATGAMIGSVVPVIGTALGGIAGAITGAVLNWDSLSGKFKKMMGLGTKEKEETPEWQKEMDKVKQREQEQRQLQRETASKQEADFAAVQAEGYSNVFKKIEKSVEDADKKAKEARKAVDDVITKEFKQQFNITVAMEEGETQVDAVNRLLAEKQTEIDKMRETGAPAKDIKPKEESLKLMTKMVSETEDNVGGLREANNQLAMQKSRQEAIVGLQAKQKDIIAAINALYQVQDQLVATTVEAMSITGELNFNEVLNGAQKTLQLIDAQVAKQQELKDMLQGQSKFSITTLVNSGKLNKSQQEELEKRKEIHGDILEQAAVLEVVANAEKEIQGATKRRTDALTKINDLHQHQISLLQAEATHANLLVQLADNYAIGVGASAKMRLQVYDKEEAFIREQNKKLAEQRVLLTEARKQGKDNYVLRTQVQQTENEIAQAQIRQAQAVKSMRDAWVSAIASMSTGAEGFAEIVMNAEQNTAQVMMLDGAIRSAQSGAIGLRDVFGNIVEDVGYLGSERMNQFGQIAAKGGRGGDIWRGAYETQADVAMGGGDRSFRHLFEGQRDSARRLGEGIANQAQQTVSSGLETLGAMSHDIIKGTVVGAGGVNREISSELRREGRLRGKGGKREEDRRRGREEARRRDSTASTAYEPGSGQQVFEQETTVKMDPKWEEAFKGTPEGTQASLIVNRKTDAVPVYIVNVRELSNVDSVANLMAGSPPTARETREANQSRLEAGVEFDLSDEILRLNAATVASNEISKKHLESQEELNKQMSRMGDLQTVSIDELRTNNKLTSNQRQYLQKLKESGTTDIDKTTLLAMTNKGSEDMMRALSEMTDNIDVRTSKKNEKIARRHDIGQEELARVMMQLSGKQTIAVDALLENKNLSNTQVDILSKIKESGTKAVGQIVIRDVIVQSRETDKARMQMSSGAVEENSKLLQEHIDGQVKLVEVMSELKDKEKININELAKSKDLSDIQRGMISEFKSKGVNSIGKVEIADVITRSTTATKEEVEKSIPVEQRLDKTRKQISSLEQALGKQDFTGASKEFANKISEWKGEEVTTRAAKKEYEAYRDPRMAETEANFAAAIEKAEGPGAMWRGLGNLLSSEGEFKTYKEPEQLKATATEKEFRESAMEGREYSDSLLSDIVSTLQEQKKLQDYSNKEIQTAMKLMVTHGSTGAAIGALSKGMTKKETFGIDAGDKKMIDVLTKLSGVAEVQLAEKALAGTPEEKFDKVVRLMHRTGAGTNISSDDYRYYDDEAFKKFESLGSGLGKTYDEIDNLRAGIGVLSGIETKDKATGKEIAITKILEQGKQNIDEQASMIKSFITGEKMQYFDEEGRQRTKTVSREEAMKEVTAQPLLALFDDPKFYGAQAKLADQLDMVAEAAKGLNEGLIDATRIAIAQPRVKEAREEKLKELQDKQKMLAAQLLFNKVVEGAKEVGGKVKDFLFPEKFGKEKMREDIEKGEKRVKQKRDVVRVLKEERSAKQDSKKQINVAKERVEKLKEEKAPAKEIAKAEERVKILEAPIKELSIAKEQLVALKEQKAPEAQIIKAEETVKRLEGPSRKDIAAAQQDYNLERTQVRANEAQLRTVEINEREQEKYNKQQFAARKKSDLRIMQRDRRELGSAGLTKRAFEKGEEIKAKMAEEYAPKTIMATGAEGAKPGRGAVPEDTMSRAKSEEAAPLMQQGGTSMNLIGSNFNININYTALTQAINSAVSQAISHVNNAVANLGEGRSPNTPK